MKIIKNEVYILRKPSHVVLSIINVAPGFPLTDLQQQSIDKLTENTDVFFIFPESMNTINPDKFSSLYQGIGWLQAGDSIGESVFKVLEYSKEILNGYVSYCFIESGNLKIDSTAIHNIVEVSGSSISKPIFKPSRLTNQDLYAIYKEEPKKRKWFDIFKNRENDDEEIRDMFCTYTSESQIIFLKTGTINLLLEHKKDNDKFLRSFNYRNDLRFMITSMIKYFGIDILEYNIEELSGIGKISQDEKTKGI